MCRQEQTKGRWFFDSIDHYCWCRAGSMGPLTCEFYHFARFSNGADGRRVFRTDYEFNAISLVGGIFWFLWASLYWIFIPFVWSTRATYNIFKKASWFTYILVPVVWVTLLAGMLVCNLLYILIIVMCLQVWVIPCLMCAYKNTPLTRDPAFK